MPTKRRSTGAAGLRGDLPRKSAPKQDPWARSAGGTVRPLAVASGKRLGPIIYELIKKRLLEGGYAAGERIDIEALRAEFDVSRQPVMEAMRRLASEGLVEIVPQVGCRVPVYTASDVEDFFTMFAVMEGSVAGVAAERHSDAELGALEDANRQIADLAAVPDPARRSHGYRVLNREFHTTINGMAHSAVIADISRRMWDMADLLINTAGVTQPLAGAIRGRHEDHDQIIAAIRNRDSISARAEMERHILGTIAIIRSEAAS